MMTLPFPTASAESTASAKPAADRRSSFEAVDHHFDVVPHLAIEREIVAERNNAAIHAGADEPLLAQVFEQVFVFALLAANDGGEHGILGAGRERHDARNDLLARLCGNRPPALRAVAVADAGIEHAEKIVDFGDRADRRPRVRCPTISAKSRSTG